MNLRCLNLHSCDFFNGDGTSVLQGDQKTAHNRRNGSLNALTIVIFLNRIWGKLFYIQLLDIQSELQLSARIL